MSLLVQAVQGECRLKVLDLVPKISEATFCHPFDFLKPAYAGRNTFQVATQHRHGAGLRLFGVFRGDKGPEGLQRGK